MKYSDMQIFAFGICYCIIFCPLLFFDLTFFKCMILLIYADQKRC